MEVTANLILGKIKQTRHFSNKQYHTFLSVATKFWNSLKIGRKHKQEEITPTCLCCGRVLKKQPEENNEFALCSLCDSI